MVILRIADLEAGNVGDEVPWTWNQ
jgi:hypothetical protein